MITNELTKRKIKLNPDLYNEFQDAQNNIENLNATLSNKKLQLANKLQGNFTDADKQDYDKAVKDLEENSQEAKELLKLQAIARLKYAELQEKFFKTYKTETQVIKSCKAFVNELSKSDFDNKLKESKKTFKSITETLTKEQIEKIKPYYIIEDTPENCFGYFTSLEDYYLLKALCSNKGVSASVLTDLLIKKISSYYPSENPLNLKDAAAIGFIAKQIEHSIILIDKVTDKTFNGNILKATQKSIKQKEKGSVYVDVASKQQKLEKKHISVGINIDFAGLGNSAKDLTRAEQGVYNAICTFYENEHNDKNQCFFTVDSLYKEITGNKTARLTEAKRKELDSIIERFMSILIQIDNRQEAEAYNLATMTTAKTNLCHITKVTETEFYNGMIVNEGYIIMGEPILLTYAKIRKQLATINKKYIPKVRENEVTIRQYLLREIELMKGKSQRTNILSYKTIYEYEGIDKSDRKKKSVIRDRVKKILDAMKESGYIYDYKERKKQGIIDSIEVILKKPNEPQ